MQHRTGLTAPLPRPAAPPESLPPPVDVPYPGVLQLSIDATDTDRGILNAGMVIPVANPGPMILLYPEWMPGYHSPRNPLQLFAGLVIRAGDRVLDWHRDPVEVYAFHIDVPADVAELHVTFQFLSPTTSSQGDVVVTHEIMNLQWGRMILYPAGFFSRGITVCLRLRLPPGWAHETALGGAADADGTLVFDPVSLDVLVDSPVMAARAMTCFTLDEDAGINLALFGGTQDGLTLSDEQIALHRSLVVQTQRLFRSFHFDRYRFLVALNDEIGGGGVEHHRSSEIVLSPDYFRDWDANMTGRDVFAHEFTHSWNGKFRKGADSWTPSFEEPIRNSLMWVYEGQTQYWGQVLTARSGLWSRQTALEALAKTAATYDVRPGNTWRTMADTTRDPIIAAREPLPWPSWQRSEDYYSLGQLMWLSVDTLIREQTDDSRSLDDFAARFFGIEPGRMAPITYEFQDIVESLNAILDYDWSGFFRRELENRDAGAPLQGLERGGYRLVYENDRSGFCKSYDSAHQQYDLRFSLGLNIASKGAILEVMWDSPAFAAGLTTGSEIVAIDGQPYDEDLMREAVGRTPDTGRVALTVATRSFRRDVEIVYDAGHRFPHLAPTQVGGQRLDAIFAPLDR